MAGASYNKTQLKKQKDYFMKMLLAIGLVITSLSSPSEAKQRRNCFIRDKGKKLISATAERNQVACNRRSAKAFDGKYSGANAAKAINNYYVATFKKGFKSTKSTYPMCINLVSPKNQLSSYTKQQCIKHTKWLGNGDAYYLEGSKHVLVYAFNCILKDLRGKIIASDYQPDKKQCTKLMVKMYRKKLKGAVQAQIIHDGKTVQKLPMNRRGRGRDR